MAKGKPRKFTARDKETIFRIFRYIRKYMHLVLLSLILAAATVVLTLYIPILTGDAVNTIVGKGSVDFVSLKKILMKMVGMILCTGLTQWLMNHINNIVTFRVVEDIRTRAFDHISDLPVGYLDAHPAGDLTSRVITDIDTFSQGLLMGFTQLFTGVLTIIGTLGFMFYIEPGITLLVILLTPLSFLVAGQIAKHTYKLFRHQAESRGEITAFTEEMVGNLKLVKAFSHEKEAEKRFREINDVLSKYSLNAVFISSLVNPATRCVNSIVYAAVGVGGAWFAIRGLITVGELVSFLSYANQYMKPFNEISGVVTELQNAIASASRVFEIIDEKPLEPDKENAEVLKEAAGKIDMDHLWFSYDKTRKLLTDINVHVEPGETVAIVGPTGCGKSTLINLLMRFYEADRGGIRIDGVDNRSMTRESLRNNFGMVLQETWLKSATVRENISYGKPDATMEEIVAAAKKAHCDGFIRKMPKGYDTVLGEEGGALSQGQKQLLCIARLMLRLPPMLILDEATSSIDTRTELHIQHAFDRMMKGRTSFIVAHRLSTIKNADLILVMKDGNIIEQGRHEELLQKGGFYATLYNSQFQQNGNV